MIVTQLFVYEKFNNIIVTIYFLKSTPSSTKNCDMAILKSHLKYVFAIMQGII